MARLIFKFKDKVLDIVPLTPTQGVTIGRHQTNAVVIDNLAVSGFHARIDMNADGVLLTDLESKNGTFINGQRMNQGPLNHKDAVTVGKHTLVLDLHGDIPVDGEKVAPPQVAPSDVSAAGTMFLDASGGPRMQSGAPSPAPPPEAAYAGRDNLTILAGGQGEISLSQKPVTIGSNRDADITVGGLWGLLVGGPAVTIRKQAADYVLRYTGGLIKPKRNGTSVKGTIKLNHEDVVDIGPVRVQVMLSKP